MSLTVTPRVTHSNIKEDESPYMPKFCDVCNEWFRNPDTFDAHLGMRGHRKRSESAP